MTVAELIAELNNLDPNLELKGYSSSHEYDVVGVIVSEDDIAEGRNVAYIDLSW